MAQSKEEEIIKAGNEHFLSENTPAVEDQGCMEQDATLSLSDLRALVSKELAELRHKQYSNQEVESSEGNLSDLLPLELWHLVASLLNPKDYVSLALTCSHLSSLAFEEQYWRVTLDIISIPFNTPPPQNLIKAQFLLMWPKSPLLEMLNENHSAMSWKEKYKTVHEHEHAPWGSFTIDREGLFKLKYHPDGSMIPFPPR